MEAPKDKNNEKVDFDPSTLPPGATLSFGEDGNLIVKNRAFRRQRMSLFPKTSQLRKKNKRKKKK